MKQDDWGPWSGSKQGGNQYPPPGGGYPPPGGGYPPGYPPGGGYGHRPSGGGGLAIASLVLGILSLVFIWSFIGYIIMAPLAIIFGAVSKKQGNTGGMATAGIVMGIISLALGILFWIACMTICAAVSPMFWF